MRLAEVAQLVDATIEGDAEFEISGLADLDSAEPSDLSFVDTQGIGRGARDFTRSMRKSAAGALLISDDVERLEGKHYLVVERTSLAFQTLLNHFYPEVASGFSGVHPTAIVDPSSQIAPDVVLGPYVVIDRDVTIGSGTILGPSVSIGPECVIGSDCHLDTRVTLGAQTHLGDRVWIQSGSVIGSSGFGYATDAQGRHQRLRQVGRVIIEDDVEIGALTAIDRARFGETRIRRGSKIDNLVQIAHGVEVGEDNLIAGQTGIAGSTKLGRHVVLGGQVAVTGHATLADGVIVAGRAGVMGSLTEPGKYVGEPARSFTEARKWYGRIATLGKLYDRVKALEEEVNSSSSKS